MGASNAVLAIILLVLCLMAIIEFFGLPYFLMRDDLNLQIASKKQEQNQNRNQDQDHIFENVFHSIDNASAFLEDTEDSNKP